MNLLLIIFITIQRLRPEVMVKIVEQKVLIQFNCYKCCSITLHDVASVRAGERGRISELPHSRRLSSSYPIS